MRKLMLIPFLVLFISCESDNLNEYSGEIPFTDYSLEESSCQWIETEYNNVVVINSYMNLKKYTHCSKWNVPKINFDKKSLLLVSGRTPGGIGTLSKKLTKDRDGYLLQIEIELNETTIAGQDWQVAIIIPKLSKNSDIKLDVKTIKN